MRKTATILLLILAFGMTLTGAVTAQDVEVEVVDNNGEPVDVTSPGDEVTIEVDASAEDLYIPDPFVEINVDPESGLSINPATVTMIYIYDDGSSDTYINDPLDPFFYPSSINESWIWWIGWALDDNTMWPDEQAQLIIPALVTDTGKIAVNSAFYQWPIEYSDPILMDFDRYTFESVGPGPGPCPPPEPCKPAASAKTVPMKDTGTCIGIFALSICTIISGLFIGKLR